MAGILDEELLNMLASIGLTDDHEVVSPEEAFRKLVRGIAVFVREGSSERNLVDVLSGLKTKIRDYRLLMFCTDDKHPTDIIREGHIDYNIRKAIELGLDPIVAIQMATINPAMYFRVDDLIGSITPGRKADLLVVDNLEKLNIRTVIFDGEIVYHEGRLLFEPSKVDLPEWAVKTVRLNPGLKPEDLLLRTNVAEGRALARVIEITPGQILKRELLEWLRIENGFILSDPSRDILHIAVVERHRGLLNVGKAFVKGFKLRKGAIASSVSHDHHNIVVVGVDNLDMYIAVKRLSEINGGFVAVSEGRIVSEIPLEFAGLMSVRRYEEVVEELTRLNNAVRNVLGSELSNPFMQLEFVSLPSIPELGLTDRGLVKDYEIVEPILEVSN
jgi:adenine deaminase